MKGFTLVETLVVAAIFLVVGTLLASILVNNTGLYNSQTALVASGLSVNEVVNNIENNIRQASSVANGYPDVMPIYSSNNSTLVLKIPSYNSNGVISNTYDHVVVTRDVVKTNLLMLYIFPDSASSRVSQTRVLSNILKSIRFVYLDKNDNEVSPATAVKVKTEVTIQPSRSAVIVTNLRNL